MPKIKEFQTSPFTIAHYILLFMVTVVCISIVAWLIITRYNDEQAKNNITITHLTNDDPCVKSARDAVAQMWAYNQELVPPRYKTMAETYANEAVLSRVTGYCNDVQFTCRAGQLRRICDPCAVALGRQYAIEQHTIDMIRANCGYDLN